MQEIRLSAALEFAQQGFAHGAVVFAAYEGLDGESFLWRRGNHREVSDALKRHAERARNRRSGERQDVDLGAQRFECFFLAHTKTMFFVDDDKAESFKVDIFGQYLVCPDDDIDCSVADPVDRATDFLG